MSATTRYRWRRLVLAAQIARQERRVRALKRGLRFPAKVRERSFGEEFFRALALFLLSWALYALAALF